MNCQLAIQILSERFTMRFIAQESGIHENTLYRLQKHDMAFINGTREKLRKTFWQHLSCDELEQCDMDVEAHIKRADRVVAAECVVGMYG